MGREDQNFVLIQRIMRISKQCWNDSKDKLGNNEKLTSMQYNICLAVQGEPGISQDGIAKFLFMDKSSVAKLVSKLVAAKLVKREVNPDDRREYRLFLTPEGEEMIKQLSENISEWEANIFGKPGDASYEQWIEAVEKAENKLYKNG